MEQNFSYKQYKAWIILVFLYAIFKLIFRRESAGFSAPSAKRASANINGPNAQHSPQDRKHALLVILVIFLYYIFEEELWKKKSQR